MSGGILVCLCYPEENQWVGYWKVWGGVCEDADVQWRDEGMLEMLLAFVLEWREAYDHTWVPSGMSLQKGRAPESQSGPQRVSDV